MVILIVDSSPLIIERLQNLLADTTSIKVIYGAVSYKDAIKLFNEINPDVVLLDCSLPENMSMDLLKEIKRVRPDTTVIALANRIDEKIQKEFNSSGADFFFDKYYEFEKIPGTLQSIAAQKKE